MYVNPLYYQVLLGEMFLSLHTELGSPLSYNPHFAHTLLALSKILGLYVS